MVDREVGDLDRAFAAADALLARCLEHGFAQLLPLAAIAVAAGKVHGEKDLAALKSIGDNLTALGAVGARTPAAYWLAWLAEALLSVGAAADALGALEHALGASATGLDHLYDAELHRLKAVALLALGKPDAEVDTEFERSLEIAREREHALFALKTACDYGELLAKRGDRPRAHELLAQALAQVEASEVPVVARANELRDWL
jgi:adenylate cyclase